MAEKTISIPMPSALSSFTTFTVPKKSGSFGTTPGTKKQNVLCSFDRTVISGACKFTKARWNVLAVSNRDQGVAIGLSYTTITTSISVTHTFYTVSAQRTIEAEALGSTDNYRFSGGNFYLYFYATNLDSTNHTVQFSNYSNTLTLTYNPACYVTFTGDGITERTDTVSGGIVPDYGSTPSAYNGRPFIGWQSSLTGQTYTGTLPEADDQDVTYTAVYGSASVEITAVSMTYSNSQISASNKVPVGQSFIINVTTSS